ncbi:MAG: hypothetical protein ACFCU2_13830 [Acidimicrobiia bacterium]
MSELSTKPPKDLVVIPELPHLSRQTLSTTVAVNFGSDAVEMSSPVIPS